jgi:hypothetical protein
MRSYYPYDHSDTYGYGKEGRPINFDHYPLIDPVTILDSFEPDTLVTEHIWSMEQALKRAENQSEKLGRAVYDQVFLFNMHNLAFKHLHGPVMEEIKEVFQIDEKYYPELVACAIVINAPKIFQVCLFVFFVYF